MWSKLGVSCLREGKSRCRVRARMLWGEQPLAVETSRYGQSSSTHQQDATCGVQYGSDCHGNMPYPEDHAPRQTR